MAARLACIVIPADTMQAEILPSNKSNVMACRIRAIRCSQKSITNHLTNCSIYHKIREDGVYIFFFSLLATTTTIVNAITGLLCGMCDPAQPSYGYEFDGDGDVHLFFTDVTPEQPHSIVEIYQAVDDRKQLSLQQWRQFATRIQESSIVVTSALGEDNITVVLAKHAANNFLVALEALANLLPLE